MTDKSLQTKGNLPEMWQSVWDKRQPDKDFNRNRFYNVILICFFFGLFAIFFFGHRTLISAYQLSKITIFLCVIGLLIPWKFYHKWFSFTRIDIFIFNLFGFGPLLSGLLLTINYGLHSPVVDEYYRIEETYIETYGKVFGIPKLLIQLEGGAYDANKELRLFEAKDFDSGIIPVGIKYSLADGALGYRVLLDYQFAYPLNQEN